MRVRLLALFPLPPQIQSGERLRMRLLSRSWGRRGQIVEQSARLAEAAKRELEGQRSFLGMEVRDES